MGIQVNVLTVNAGSSSLKIARFTIDADVEKCLARASVERIATETGRMSIKDDAGRVIAERDTRHDDHVHAFGDVMDALDEASLLDVDAVGHRFVHGGPNHQTPARIDAPLRASLTALVRFAPLHLPSELSLLDASSARFPSVTQVACFDTAFHRTMPEVAERFALPRNLYDAGVRRYGFHGLSYEYVVETIGAAKLGRAVIAHLGSGASLAAVKEGRSVDTTMGLTPAGGLVMATRAGDLDPGVLVYLMDHHASDAREIEALLNQRSGLLGISGTSSDVKALLDASSHDAQAALAIQMFCYTVRKFIGAMTSVLGGLDTLVFTGGIGEHAAPIRDSICAGLAYLGEHRVLVVSTDEERMIARHTFRVHSSGAPRRPLM